MTTFSSSLLCSAQLPGICPDFRGVLPTSTPCLPSDSRAWLAEYSSDLVRRKDMLGISALLRSTTFPSPSTSLQVLPERRAHAHFGRKAVPNVQVNVVRPALSNSARRPEQTGTAALNAGKDLLSGVSGPETAFGSWEAPLQECTVCQRSKFLVDFEKTVTTVEKRTEFCRACLATHRAMRMGRPLHHLSLSVDAAWDKGKACLRCGHLKEIRDYARNNIKADGFEIYCRACICEKRAARIELPPVDAPQQCRACGQAKAASEFYANKGNSTGLGTICKRCGIKSTLKYRAKIGAATSLPRDKKVCSNCGESKNVAEFYRAPGSIDGYGGLCKNCAIDRSTAAQKLRRKGPVG